MKSIITGMISKDTRVHEADGVLLVADYSDTRMMIESAEATQHSIQTGSSD